MKQLCRALLLLSVTFIYSQNPEVEIMNTSINSVYAELGVTFLNNNTLIFASSKKVTTDKNFSKKRTRTNKHLNLTLYQGVITDKGDIIQTKKFSNEKNNKVHESEISFTPDGKTVYFTWNNFYNTQKRKDSAKWKTLQVMRGSINEKFEISNITHLPFNSEEYSVRCPEVSKDGKQLFFASDMPGNIGGHDIYVVDILNDNSFSQPKNLGKNVNTKLHEFYPFIDENNTLYFSSYGHKGLGDLDIFKSEYKNNNYQLAENLQAPINSKYDDFGFVIKNYNKTGFFTSNRDGSIGGVDIYAFKTKEKECKPILYVTVLNKETNEIILKPSVLIYENKQLLENNSYQNSTDINFNLRCLQPYKITAKKEGFSVAEIEFETNDLSDTVHKKIYLTPLICNQTISGFVFNNKDKQQIESAKVSLFVNKELKETKVTKLNEKFSFTIECGNSYKIITEKDGFVSDEKEFNIDNTRDKLVTADVQLTPLICNQTISGFVFNDKDKQQIQLAKVSLFVNNQLKETQVTQLNTKFSFTIECGNSYKIITEKEGFVTDEKDFNIDNTRDKLVTADIQLTPLICNQTISGFVFNEKDKQQIELVKVSLFVNNQLKETQVTQLNTKFSFTIECGNSYKIITEKEGFVTDEKDFNIDNTRDKTVAADIQLTPLICNQTISGFVFNDKDRQQIELAKVSLFVNNKLKETQVTQQNTKFSFTIECGNSYKIITEKDGFVSDEKEFNIDNTRDKLVTADIQLTPLICNQIISGFVFNEKDKQQIELAKVSLFMNNQLKETQVTQLNTKFSFTIECGNSYKIITEKDGFVSDEKDFNIDNTRDKTVAADIQLTPLICNQTISGFVFNEKDKQQIESAKISLFVNNKLKETQVTQSNTKFSFTIECGNSYKIVTEKDGFVTSEKKFNIDNTRDKLITADVQLTPVICNSLISGTILDIDTKKQLAIATVKIYQNNLLIENLSLDTNANFNFKGECNSEYKIIASLKNHKNAAVTIATSTKNNEAIHKVLLLESIIEFITTTNQKMIKTKAITFDLDSDEISTNTAIELNKVVGVLLKYPTMQIDIQSHTDSRAPDNYNLTLSEDRVLSIINYIESQGIDRNRVTGEGYGETQLLNKCANGVKCSNAEHEENRRTEFIILSE